MFKLLSLRSPAKRSWFPRPERRTSTFAKPLVVRRRKDLEPPSRYERGGYHPVLIGDTLNGRYEVVQQLGWGVHATVWLARDTSSQQMKALKILVGKMTYNSVGLDELGLLKTVRTANSNVPGYRHVCHLLDDFSLEGPHGTHTCLVLDPMGVDVLDIYRSLQGPMPPFLLKRITKHVLRGLQFLHEDCGIIHADIKGDNILMSGIPYPLGHPELIFEKDDLKSSTFKLTDFGVSLRTSDPVNLELLIQPEALRAPENIIRAGWTTKIDLWNLGCLVFEFACGRKLFDPRFKNTETGLLPGQEHLIQITGLFGSYPTSLLKRGQSAPKYFNDDGHLFAKDEKRPVMTLDKRLIAGGFPASDVAGLSDFLRKALVIDPDERSSARHLLDHPWIQGVE